MKPIDLFSTNLVSESGRREINSFINGKSSNLKSKFVNYKVCIINMAFQGLNLYLEKTNGKIPEMYKDVLDKDTLIALGHFKLHDSCFRAFPKIEL